MIKFQHLTHPSDVQFFKEHLALCLSLKNIKTEEEYTKWINSQIEFYRNCLIEVSEKVNLVV